MCLFLQRGIAYHIQGARILGGVNLYRLAHPPRGVVNRMNRKTGRRLVVYLLDAGSSASSARERMAEARDPWHFLVEYLRCQPAPT